MNIVIFGSDNSGKTTLAKVLDSFVGGYIHSPGPLPTVDLQKRFIIDNLDKNPVNIFDRFPIIEESVCRTILRGVNNFSDESVFISDTLDKIDLFIYCSPGINSIINWGDREQMSGIKENINELVKGYESIYNYLIENNYNCVKYDYNINGRFIKYEEVDN